ncbi:MAG: hypothetical protein NZ899_11465 [Thermoguttaceae bacterium]|nr:hypothetical protein [Thermoguttaceae bacterium]
MRAFIFPLRLALALFGGIVLSKLMPGVVRAEQFVPTACDTPAVICPHSSPGSWEWEEADRVLMPVHSEADLGRWLPIALGQAETDGPSRVPRKFTYPEPASEYEAAIRDSELGGPDSLPSSPEGLATATAAIPQQDQGPQSGGDVPTPEAFDDVAISAQLDDHQYLDEADYDGFEATPSGEMVSEETSADAQGPGQAPDGDFPYPVIEEDPLRGSSLDASQLCQAQHQTNLAPDSSTQEFLEDSGEGWDRGETVAPESAENQSAADGFTHAEHATGGITPEEWSLEVTGGEALTESKGFSGSPPQVEEATEVEEWQWYDFRGFGGEETAAEEFSDSAVVQELPSTSDTAAVPAPVPEAYDPWCYYGYHLDDIFATVPPVTHEATPSQLREEPDLTGAGGAEASPLAETEDTSNWTLESARPWAEMDLEASEEADRTEGPRQSAVPAPSSESTWPNSGAVSYENPTSDHSTVELEVWDEQESWEDYGEWDELNIQASPAPEQGWSNPSAEEAETSLRDSEVEAEAEPSDIGMTGDPTGEPVIISEPQMECPLSGPGDEAVYQAPADISSKYYYHYEVYQSGPAEERGIPADPEVSGDESEAWVDEAEASELPEGEFPDDQPAEIGESLDDSAGIQSEAEPLSQSEPNTGIPAYRYEYWQYRDPMPEGTGDWKDEPSPWNTSPEHYALPSSLEEAAEPSQPYGLLEDDLYWQNRALSSPRAAEDGNFNAPTEPVQEPSHADFDAASRAQEVDPRASEYPTPQSEAGEPAVSSDLSVPAHWANPELWLDEESLGWLKAPHQEGPAPPAETPSQTAGHSGEPAGEATPEPEAGTADSAEGGGEARNEAQPQVSEDLFHSESSWQVAALREQYARLALGATAINPPDPIEREQPELTPRADSTPRLPVPTGIVLFATQPEKLLTPADFEVLRYTRLLAQRSAAEARAYFDGYLSTLGWHAFDLAGRLRSWQGQNWPTADAGLTTASLLLGVCRLVERGELGVDEAGRVLEQSLAGQSAEWSEALLAAIAEPADTPLSVAGTDLPLYEGKTAGESTSDFRDAPAAAETTHASSPIPSADNPPPAQSTKLGQILNAGVRYVSWATVRQAEELVRTCNSLFTSWLGSFDVRRLEAALAELARRMVSESPR